VSLQGLLEPVARKRAWPVLRGRGRGNASSLPDEIYFSVVQRKVVSPSDLTDLAEVEKRLAEFENATTPPPDRSGGCSHVTTWTTYSRGSVNMNNNRRSPSSSRLPHDHPRRTSETDHLAMSTTEREPPDRAGPGCQVSRCSLS
jgi:hypothetical protein